METYELDSTTYWKNPFLPILDRGMLRPYRVINIENADFEVNESKAARRMKFKFAEVEVQRDSDIGVNDQTYFCYTHLGDIINYDDTLLCYDLESANFQDDILSILDSMKKQMPDVVVVKKSYPKTRNRTKNKGRNWKLKHLDVEEHEGLDDDEDAKKTKKPEKTSKRKKKVEKAFVKKNKDYEEFLKDLEEDKELRSMVNLYKKDSAKAPKEVEDLKENLDKLELDDIEKAEPEAKTDPTAPKEDGKDGDNESDSDVDENFPAIKEDELLK